jgi:hypothetical protein
MDLPVVLIQQPETSNYNKLSKRDVRRDQGNPDNSRTVIGAPAEARAETKTMNRPKPTGSSTLGHVTFQAI